MDKEVKLTCISCYNKNYALIYDEIGQVNYCLLREKKCREYDSNSPFFCTIIINLILLFLEK